MKSRLNLDGDCREESDYKKVRVIDALRMFVRNDFCEFIFSELSEMGEVFDRNIILKYILNTVAPVEISQYSYSEFDQFAFYQTACEYGLVINFKNGDKFDIRYSRTRNSKKFTSLVLVDRQLHLSPIDPAINLVSKGVKSRVSAK